VVRKVYNLTMLALLEWIQGEWYLAVRCRSCDVQFAFLRDGETNDTAYFTDLNTIVLTCPDCYIPNAYCGEQVERFQAR
jgi:nitrate/TMAO reductase-like tetraheme cytochrome c subunit